MKSVRIPRIRKIKIFSNFREYYYLNPMTYLRALFFSVFFISPFFLISQNVSFVEGEKLTNEGDNSGYDYFKLGNPQEQEVGYHWKANRFKMVGETDDYYFAQIFEPTKKTFGNGVANGIFVFNKDLTLKKTLVLENNFGHENSQFLTSIFVDQQVTVFYSQEFDKQNKIYRMTLNSESLVFSEPTLLFDIPDKRIDGFYTSISPNNEHYALAIEYGQFEDDCSFAVYSKNHEEKLKKDNVSHKLEVAHDLDQLHISNDRELTFTYVEKKGVDNMKLYETGDEYLTWLYYDSTGVSKSTYLEIDKYVIMHSNPIEDGKKMFVSWFYHYDNRKTGFSIYNKATGEAELTHQIDAKWIEPYFKRGSVGIEDFSRGARPNGSGASNAFYDLLDYEKNGDYLNIVIKKSTETKYVHRSSTAEPGTSPTISNTIQGSEVRQEGDICFFRFNNGELTDKGKIERNGTAGVPHFAVFINSEKNYIFLHYSKLPEEELKGTNMMNAFANIKHDHSLYISIVSKADWETKTSLVKKYENKNDQQYYFASYQPLIKDNCVITLGSANGSYNERLFKINISLD